MDIMVFWILVQEKIYEIIESSFLKVYPKVHPRYIVRKKKEGECTIKYGGKV